MPLWLRASRLDGVGCKHQLYDMNAAISLPEVFSQHPDVMSGAMVFNGTRVPVQTFFDHLDHGGTLEQFLEWYDGMTREQLEAAAEIRTVPSASS